MANGFVQVQKPQRRGSPLVLDSEGGDFFSNFADQFIASRFNARQFAIQEAGEERLQQEAKFRRAIDSFNAAVKIAPEGTTFADMPQMQSTIDTILGEGAYVQLVNMGTDLRPETIDGILDKQAIASLKTDPELRNNLAEYYTVKAATGQAASFQGLRNARQIERLTGEALTAFEQQMRNEKTQFDLARKALGLDIEFTFTDADGKQQTLTKDGWDIYVALKDLMFKTKAGGVDPTEMLKLYKDTAKFMAESVFEKSGEIIDQSKLVALMQMRDAGLTLKDGKDGKEGTKLYNDDVLDYLIANRPDVAKEAALLREGFKTIAAGIGNGMLNDGGIAYMQVLEDLGIKIDQLPQDQREEIVNIVLDKFITPEARARLEAAGYFPGRNKWLNFSRGLPVIGAVQNKIDELSSGVRNSLRGVRPAGAPPLAPSTGQPAPATTQPGTPTPEQQAQIADVRIRFFAEQLQKGTTEEVLRENANMTDEELQAALESIQKSERTGKPGQPVEDLSGLPSDLKLEFTAPGKPVDIMAGMPDISDIEITPEMQARLGALVPRAVREFQKLIQKKPRGRPGKE